MTRPVEEILENVIRLVNWLDADDLQDRQNLPILEIAKELGTDLGIVPLQGRKLSDAENFHEVVASLF